MTEDLEFEIKLYEKNKELSERILQSVDGLKVKSFLENLLMEAYLAIPDGKNTAHELQYPKGLMQKDIKYLTDNNYASLTFSELKEKDALEYYLIIRSLRYIKDHPKIRKILTF